MLKSLISLPSTYMYVNDIHVCQLDHDYIICFKTFLFLVGKLSICYLEKKVGPCKAAIPRYYHSTYTGKCEKFTWGGCKPNENNFKTLMECEKSCGGNTLSTAGTSISITRGLSSKSILAWWHVDKFDCAWCRAF